MQRAKGPEDRAKGPEDRAKGPEDRAKGPEDRAKVWGQAGGRIGWGAAPALAGALTLAVWPGPPAATAG